MATSRRRPDGENDNVEWTLKYVKETKEYKCGWCGYAFISNHTHRQLQTHFQSCNKSIDAGDVAKEQPVPINIKTESGTESEFDTTDIDKKMSDIKKDMNSEINQLKKTSDAAVSTLLNKVNILEEKMREMGAEQEKKMAEVNGRVSGVTETVSTVIYSMVEVKGKESKDPDELDRLKKETEALGVQLRKSEREIQSTKSGLENQVAQLRTRAETFSNQLKTNDQECRQIKRKIEDEASKQVANKKKKSFHVEPSPFDQMTIPMNCFNLVTHNYLFQASFKWTVNDIKNKIAQKTLELSSEMFQWNGYPVQARAKIQVKEDDKVYLSLCLKEESESLADFKPIPLVYYMLRGIRLRNPKHLCLNNGYLFNSPFKYSLNYERVMCHKSWFNLPDYKVDDSIEIEIYVEPSQTTQQVHSYDGTLEWNMENYARRFQLEKYRLVYSQESPYFYTGPRGYKVQVRMFLIGEGLAARILFWTSKFDAELPNSFPHSTTVTLLNRKEPERSVSKTVVEDVKSKREYTLEICKVEQVKNLIENDTLYCKVVIKAQ